eukprot:gene1588-7965_t
MPTGQLALSASPGSGPSALPPEPFFAWGAEALWGPMSHDGDLELDKLNENPCMPTFIRLCGHMAWSPAFAVPAGEVPGWMAELLRKLRDPDCPLPVRFFIVKAVINTPQIFRGTASHWVVPLCDAALEASERGEGLNSFMRDVCVTLLEWGDDPRINGDDVGDRAGQLLEE